MARWRSVRRWPNRFVSLGAAALLTACHSMPPTPLSSLHLPATATATGGPPAAAVAADSTTAHSADRPAENAPVSVEAAQQYAEALQLMKSGRTAEAESHLKQLAQRQPTLSGPEVNLGLLYLQGGHLLEAEEAFKSALQRNPVNAIAGNGLGITQRKLGKFAEAEASYQRTIMAEPSYAPAYLNLGVLYDLYLAEPQKALEQFEHYIQLAGESKQVAGWMAELRKRVTPAAAAKKEPA